MSPSWCANSSSSRESSSRFARSAIAFTSSIVNRVGTAKFYNVTRNMLRRAAVAGSWYPGEADSLARTVDRYLAQTHRDVSGDLVALIAPHAGLMYSGPVAAHAYRLLSDRRFDVVVVGGGSHFFGFVGGA